ncbi:hypothetical protein [Paractinoplanes atraurantiacus]|uniref:Lipoprotein n=1 Tax=Paractinoplanes atraurantiacus TaxID=1036182 RepID=A0A285JWX0_9ACTN|nr:hypothetical protein [Actinoplanes atraurantiacus]SNY64790.1 hypothetical protein SAMN05421748_12749 [Actinoplanes atraurantiacus]
MHRLAQIFGATTLVVLAAACSNTTTPGAQATSAPTTAPTTAPATSATPTASASSSASPAAPPAEAAHTDPAGFTIKPDHIGPLKIGMSLKAAKATGLIVVNDGQDTAGPEACVSAHWKGQSDEDWMIFNGKHGLRAIDSFGGQKTPEGIKPGSSLASVRKAYPQLTWRVDGDETPAAKRTSGDALVDAVKGDGAHYRINVQKSKVVYVQVESDRPGCYE